MTTSPNKAHFTFLTISLALGLLILANACSAAEEKNETCASNDTACLILELESVTDSIDNQKWRDQTYREIAKLLAKEKKTDQAIGLINKIEHPDTKALTIRGIGMTAAQTDMSKAEFDQMFLNLRNYAEKIEHPPSYAIALTYIAMAQAFAGDDEGAMKTALDMKNDALRNKALAESAEIQAERGDLAQALKSIEKVDSPAFRNKAYRLISKIFAQQQNYDDALSSAEQINNSYQKAQAILFILAQQISPEEVVLVE